MSTDKNRKSRFRVLAKILQVLKGIRTNVRFEKRFDCSIDARSVFVVDDYNDISLGVGVYVGAYTVIHVRNQGTKKNAQLTIGDDTSIGEFNNIRAGGGSISIGRKCLISQHVSIVAANHEISAGKYIIDQPWSEKNNFVVIGDDVWIGTGAVILPGIRIGNGAIIGAGSVVTADIPANAIAVGSPARVHKFRE